MEERNDNKTTKQQQRNLQDASGESGAQVFTASAPAIRTRASSSSSVVEEPTTTTKGNESPSASLDDASVILPPKKNPPLRLEPRGAALRRIERAKLYARLSSEGSAMDKLSPSRALQHVRQQDEGEEEVGGGEEDEGGEGETSTREEVTKEPKDKEKETDEEDETEDKAQEEEAEAKAERKEKRKSVPPPPPRYPWEASSKEKAFPLRSQLSFNFGHHAAIIPQLTKQPKQLQQEPQHLQQDSQPMPKRYPFPKPTHGYKNTGTLIVTRSARKKAKKEQQNLTTQRNELLAAIRGFKKTRLNQLQNATPPRSSSPSKPTRRKEGSQTTVLPPPPPVLPGVDMISAISLATREEMLAAIRGFQKTKLNKTNSSSELEDEQHKEKEIEEERKTDERTSPQRTFVDPVLERVHRRTFSYERVSMKAESEEDDGTMFSVKKTTAQNEQRVRTWVGSKKSFEEESPSEAEDEDSSDSLTTSDEEEKEEELTKTTPRGIQQNNTKGKEIEEMEEDQLPPSKWKIRLARRASMLDDQNSSPATKHRNVMSWRLSLQSHKLKEERTPRRHEQRRNRERKEAKRVLPDAKYVCRRCGRLLFEGEAVVDIKSIWQLEDFEADCFVVKRIHNLHELRRYDVHLHQGWYCCGFIAMRMTVDKYGTGRHFLVYCDDVLKDFQYAQKHKNPYVPISLGQANYSRMSGSAVQNRLLCILFMARWSPPCRWMEHLFAEIVESEALKSALERELQKDASQRPQQPNNNKVSSSTKTEPGQEQEEGSTSSIHLSSRMQLCCFTVDIDIEVEFFEEWNNRGVPFVVFYYNGRQVVLRPSDHHLSSSSSFTNYFLSPSSSSSSPSTASSSSPFPTAANTKAKFQVTDGGVVGALKRSTMGKIVNMAQARLLKRGEYTVYI